ncbi:MAG: RNA replicase beta chain [Sanya fiers-like virus 41]|nr:MAG: RNA replicase beta chain [Sanya fiers-like virus 41]
MPSRKTTVRRALPKGHPLTPLSRDVASDVILDYLAELDTPVSLGVWIRYKHGCHKDLVGISLSPLSYADAESFKRDYAAVKFLSKCRGLNTGINTKEVALAGARLAEEYCKETNERIKSYRSGAVKHPLSSLLFEAKRFVADILGPLPDVFEDVGWTPGRTSSAWGDHLSYADKYSATPHVTDKARRHALRLLRDSPQWAGQLLGADGPVTPLGLATFEACTVRGNNLFVVPKNAKTDRVICYEPHMNIRLQRAVGVYLQRRLKKFGVDLTDQSINQRRARFGSKTGSLATIDLSMASDTLATELVYELLPIDWALRLDELRSAYTIWPDGSIVKNQKFSSMGNGFTFELESLLFYALARTVSNNVSVYGDDIICDTESADSVVAVLRFAGFRTNKSKTFVHGPFRESCGHDVFCGSDCSPVYLRALPKKYEDLVILHNTVSHRWAACGFIEKGWCDLLAKWRGIAPSRCGPKGYGDGHYHTSVDAACPTRAGGWLDGYWVKTFLRKYRVNKRGIDIRVGSYPDSLYRATLCAALGPSSVRSVWHNDADRRQFTYELSRVFVPTDGWAETLTV